mmetsp:Transcript_3167/g.7000  ORF Transcript_3167/g.7000 Transcript_3167/m.7000 type:complete len:484 (-) Transcript_3167:1317-2768(-)|eukprot:CAMPEP_0172321846 /NCGR_PEP_ID=MMETSP1058-20130122/44469_1 /TAXON_ID=83371 /ORGANISM="Detonula confervacea, Strain CCMP 353" /LENGTH=483 /DNA_ID=CAMNT_0013037455 /DNA_START=114 /DNA_END=1565 /DNA_ORIENTATION=-
MTFFVFNASCRGGNKKLLTSVASSLRNHEHRRIRVHHHRHCHPASLAAGRWNQNLRTFANAATAKSVAQLASNEELSAIVDQFPPGIDYAFGYGSGVLRQQPSSPSPSQPNSLNTNPGMVDIILAIDNPYDWHKCNLQSNSYHYSLMARIGGLDFVTWLQVNFGAKLYFHPFVNIDIDLNGSKSAEDSQSNGIKQTKIANTEPPKQSIQRQIKYGVVSTDDLIQDLLQWDYLYLAGRMHKPIVSIDLPHKSGCSAGTAEEQAGLAQTNNDRTDEIEDAQRSNLLSAVSASLLIHSIDNNQRSPSSLQSFPTSQLYNNIASLSYAGDFRMQTGAEDPDKVRKLVETPGMLDLWEKMYSDTLGNLQNSGLLSVVDSNKGDSVFVNHTNNHGSGGKHLETSFTDMAIRKQLVQNLPPRLRKHSDLIVGTGDSMDSIRQGSLVLRQELANIVSPAAKSQSIKGFFTAGVSKSWKYALAKFAKGRLRK